MRGAMTDTARLVAIGAWVILILLLSAPVPAGAQGEAAPLNIGSRLELFVDAYLIETMDGATRELHRPQPREVSIEFDKPWEGACSGGWTVFQDGDLFRMYYRGLPYDEAADTYGQQVTCYAESTDGIQWTKPNLGITELNGSKENNVIWTGEQSHNFSPFKDPNPAAPDSQRYKAVGGGSAMYALASADAIHWELMTPDPIIDYGPFDSHNLVFYDTVRGEYRAYMRDFLETGERTVRTCTSQDFIHWTQTQRCQYGDTPPEHLYTNATIPYFRAPHIFLSFPMRYIESRKKHEWHRFPGLCDGVFMSSRDGLNFDRSFLEGFIRPGLDPKNWIQRNNLPTWGILVTGPGELSVYFSEHYYQPGCRLRRGTLRTDGFVSVNAKYAGGEFTTKALTFEGRELVINYSTSAVGSLRIEIQDATGTPVEGFLLDQCPEIFGDEIERVVAWEGGTDVSALAGMPVRLRFAMKDADVYSIQFRP